MPKGNLIGRAVRIGANAAILVKRMMRERPHPEIGISQRHGHHVAGATLWPQRLDAACERALFINAIAYSSVNAILKSGLDKANPAHETARPAPAHANIRGNTYYQ
jgi:hypothetical protein